MREDVIEVVRKQLLQDYKFRERGEWFQSGICPACNKKELYTHAKSPWHLKCGRENRCGWSNDVKTLYPEFFERLNQRYNATPDDPNATADAYMHLVRGFPRKEIKGWYRQGKFWDQRSGKGTATVLFDVDRKQNIAMERFVETLHIPDEDGAPKARKQNFKGPHKGLVWAPPGLEFKEADEIWLVEGCIDAISLNLSGLKSVAMLSCYNYPGKFLETLPRDVTLVWALDDDPAGRKYIAKHANKARAAGFNVAAALAPSKGGKKVDWNDAYQRKEINDRWLDRCRYYGDLLIAVSPFEKALITWQRMAQNNFAVEFNDRFYWFSLDLDKFSKALESLKEAEPNETETTLRLRAAKQSGGLREIANCKFQFLYFQKSELTDEAWYYTRVNFPHGRHTHKNTFSGAQVASSSEFKKRLLSIAPGALFSGNSLQLDWIVRHHLENIKIVDTVDFVAIPRNTKPGFSATSASQTGVFTRSMTKTSSRSASCRSNR